MAKNIPLYENQQLPNAVVGAKAPFALADTSGMQNFGQAVAQSSRQAFSRIVSMRAENEYHEFLGQVRTAETDFENFVRNNPYATSNQLTSEQNRVISKLNESAGKLKTGLAKRDANLFMLDNKTNLQAKMQGIADTVIRQQETEKFELYRKSYIETGDYEKLQQLYQGNAGKLLDAETSALMFEQDAYALLANQQKAQAEAVRASLENQVTQIAADEGWTAAKKWISDPKTLNALQSEHGMDLETAKKTLVNVNAFATATEASEVQAKEQAVETTKAQVHKIAQLPADQFLAKVQDARTLINEDQNLTTDEKEAELRKIDSRVSALMKGEFDPLDEYDPVEYRSLSDAIMNNPASVKDSDITGANLTPSQISDLKDMKEKYAKSDFDKVTHDTYRRAIQSLITKRAFSGNKTKNIELGTRALIAFDQWAKEKRSPEEYQGFYNHLTSTTLHTPWYVDVFKRQSGELRYAAESNIQDLESGNIGEKRVVVVDQNGNEYTVPESQVEEAKNEGYTVK